MEQDASNSNDEINESMQGDEITYEYMPGKRMNSKILWSINEQQFYCKNTITRDGAYAYKCYEKNCWARVFVDETSGKCVKSKTNSFHDHGTKTELYNELKLKNEIKIQCLAAAPDSSVKDIFDKVVAG